MQFFRRIGILDGKVDPAAAEDILGKGEAVAHRFGFVVGIDIARTLGGCEGEGIDPAVLQLGYVLLVLVTLEFQLELLFSG